MLSEGFALIKGREILVVAFILAGFAGIFYKPVFCYDIWLHIKTGEYIVQNNYVLPETDPFSYTTGRKPLILNEWLSQIIFYFVHDGLGFRGLRLMRVFLELTALAFIFWAALQLSRRFLVALLVLLVTAYLFRTRYMIRPELFSILLFTFFYTSFITARNRFKPIHYAAFFLLCIFWVNLHPFMLSVGGLIAILLAGRVAQKIPCADRWFRVARPPFDPNIAFLLFLVASLINPYGYRIYEYVFGTTPVVKQYIPEWQPIFITLQTGVYRAITGGVLAFPLVMKGLVIGIILLFLVVIVGSYLRRVQWTLEDLLIGTLMCFLAIASARFAWLLFVPALLIVKYGRLQAENRRLPQGLRRVMAILLCIGVSLCGLYWLNEGCRRIPYNFANEIQLNKYPDVAVKILKEVTLSGRLYNPPAWGGYLLYYLYPKYKVFADTRTYLHGEESVIVSMMMQYQYPGFEKLIQKYHFDVLLFKKMFGDSRPFSSSGWTLIFENRNSAMYLRKDDPNEQNLKRIAEYYKKNNIPFDLQKGFDIKKLRKDKKLSKRLRLI